MKNLLMFVGTAAWFSGFLWMAYASTHSKTKHVDLPEEILEAKVGDTLIVLHSSKDTISLGFK